MAEYSVVPTTSWASLVAGPKDVNLQNQGSCEVRYATHTTTPTTAGMILKPGQIHPVKATTGTNIYVKANDPSSDARVGAVDVPTS